MADWLVEEGIGEHRAALVQNGRILAARLDWPGTLSPGLVADATIIARTAASPRATVRFANGEEALVDNLPRDASEGATLRLEVTRSALDEAARRKRARARITNAPSRPAPTLAQSLGARVVRRIAGWEDLWMEAWEGTVDFAGGSIQVEPTAALTAIDVDGTLPPRALALAAAPVIAATIRRLDLGGSVVIDFPTLTERDARKAVDAALSQALDDWSHERVAMNGFGLVQIVSRRERPSLIELLARRPEAAARLLLRRAELVEEAGTLQLTAHPRVAAAVLPEWEAELSRRTGRNLAWRHDDGLALHAGFVQAVSP